MFPIDWSVLARQIALIFIPVLLARLRLPQTLSDAISGPLADLLASVLVIGGTAVVGWVVWLGQRRELPAKKIEEVAKLPDVEQIVVADPALAADIPSPKVTP